jgi:hypothetical protein
MSCRKARVKRTLKSMRIIELDRNCKGSRGRRERSEMDRRYNFCLTTDGRRDKEIGQERLLMQKKIWNYTKKHHNPVSSFHRTL